ncbi:hypothetical protein J5N97_001916 [Dioscorea zingiberensis]|uniref:Uncharacterized protein n=1 Tax=Dioscorea zingiberensis TaxID=325984 RepID=A0A9D5H1Y4_9LILI|nr:hypothetical protein J5N97_001916 [Dioscorea zingiberensis]
MVVARSHGKGHRDQTPGFITEETLRLIAKLIGKWKMLEQLHFGRQSQRRLSHFEAQLDKQRTNDLFAMGDYCSCETILDEIVMQIGIHCNHFCWGCKQLEVLDVTDCGELEHSDGDMKEIATLAKGYGIEFLWQGGREDADYCGLDFPEPVEEVAFDQGSCETMSTDEHRWNGTIEALSS